MQHLNQTIDHPGAWKATSLDKSSITIPLDEQHIRVFDDAPQNIKSRGVPLYDITRAEFLLDEIENDIKTWINEIMEGRGLLLLSGLPVAKYSIEEIETIYWGIGSHFGIPMSQSNMGDRLGHVVDIGGKGPKGTRISQ